MFISAVCEESSGEDFSLRQHSLERFNGSAAKPFAVLSAFASRRAEQLVGSPVTTKILSPPKAEVKPGQELSCCTGPDRFLSRECATTSPRTLGTPTPAAPALSPSEGDREYVSRSLVCQETDLLPLQIPGSELQAPSR